MKQKTKLILVSFFQDFSFEFEKKERK